MSAFGPKRTCVAALHESAFGGKADMPALSGLPYPYQPPKLMVAWRRHVLVYLSLTDRVASYRFALERLVIGTPETHAAEVERVLNQLQG